MLHLLLFYSLLVTVCGYALWQGDRDNRSVALVCCGATLLSLLAVRPAFFSYSEVEAGLLAVDVATFVAFTLIALLSARFWPLWVSGLQLTTILSHLMKQTDLTLVPRAYAVAAVFWSYPILIILAVGTWRAHRRRSALG